MLHALLPYALTLTTVVPPLSLQLTIFTLNPFWKKHCPRTYAERARSAPEVQDASVKFEIKRVPVVIVYAVGATLGIKDGANDGSRVGTNVGGAGHSTALPDVHDTELHAVPNCALHRLG